MVDISKNPDLGAIKGAYAIHAATFNPSSPDFLEFQGFQDLCSLENASLLTAETPEGKVSGYILFRNLGEEAELLSLAVEKSFKKQGIGRELVQEMINRLKKTECQAIFLEVSEENRPARALYRGFGAEHISTRKNYYRRPNGTKEHALIKKIPVR